MKIYSVYSNFCAKIIFPVYLLSVLILSCCQPGVGRNLQKDLESEPTVYNMNNRVLAQYEMRFLVQPPSK